MLGKIELFFIMYTNNKVKLLDYLKNSNMNKNEQDEFLVAILALMLKNKKYDKFLEVLTNLDNNKFKEFWENYGSLESLEELIQNKVFVSNKITPSIVYDLFYMLKQYSISDFLDEELSNAIGNIFANLVNMDASLAYTEITRIVNEIGLGYFCMMLNYNSKIMESFKNCIMDNYPLSEDILQVYFEFFTGTIQGLSLAPVSALDNEYIMLKRKNEEEKIKKLLHKRY